MVGAWRVIRACLPLLYYSCIGFSSLSACMLPLCRTTHEVTGEEACGTVLVKLLDSTRPNSVSGAAIPLISTLKPYTRCRV